jgi:hypothetical protein
MILEITIPAGTLTVAYLLHLELFWVPGTRETYWDREQQSPADVKLCGHEELAVMVEFVRVQEGKSATLFFEFDTASLN